MNSYHIRKKDGAELGELSLVEIVNRVRRGHIAPDDEINYRAENGWVELKECKDFQAEVIKYLNLNHEDIKSGKDTDWFVLKADNCFGPFSYFDMISMLQKKELHEFDFVWRDGLVTWKRIAEVSEFSVEEIKFIMNVLGYSEAFFRRRHRRVNYNAQILVHNNDDLFHGMSLEISAGGAGVVINSPQLHPGDKIKLHFKPGGELPAFNARCEVVSKQFVDKVEGVNQPTKYGLKFIQIDSVIMKQLDQYSRKVS